MPACAGFGYCAEATSAFVAEAAASGAEVRFSEAVLDVRMQHPQSGPSQVAGEYCRRHLSQSLLHTPF